MATTPASPAVIEALRTCFQISDLTSIGKESCIQLIQSAFKLLGRLATTPESVQSMHDQGVYRAAIKAVSSDLALVSAPEVAHSLLMSLGSATATPQEEVLKEEVEGRPSR